MERDAIRTRFLEFMLVAEELENPLESINSMIEHSRTFWERVFDLFKELFRPDMASIMRIVDYDMVDIGTASGRITHLYKSLLADTMFSSVRNIDFELYFRKYSLLEKDSPYETVLENAMDVFDDGKVDHSLVKYFVEEKEVVLTYFCYVKALMSVRDCILIDFFRKHDNRFDENIALAIVELYKCLDLEEYIFKIDNLLRVRELTFLTSLDFFFYFRDKYDSDLKSFDEDLSPYKVLFTFRLSVGGDLGVIPVYLVV